jgi:hypothetical protein
MADMVSKMALMWITKPDTNDSHSLSYNTGFIAAHKPNKLQSETEFSYIFLQV